MRDLFLTALLYASLLELYLPGLSLVERDVSWLQTVYAGALRLFGELIDACACFDLAGFYVDWQSV